MLRHIQLHTHTHTHTSHTHTHTQLHTTTTTATTTAELVVVFSATGEAPRVVAKYRPPCPVVVVTDNLTVARHCGALFGAHAFAVTSLQAGDAGALTRAAARWARDEGLWAGERAVLALSGKLEANADFQPEASVLAPGAVLPAPEAAAAAAATPSPMRSLRRTQSIAA